MNRRWVLLGCAGLGAGAMYLLDPDRGRRRRALLRDRVVHGVRSTGETLDVRARRFANRWHGLLAKARPPLAAKPIPDAVLAERVRSQIGHVPCHARSIDVSVRDGCVTLSGPVAGDEVRKLLARVSRIRGVDRVENDLEVYEEGRPGS